MKRFFLFFTVLSVVFSSLSGVGAVFATETTVQNAEREFYVSPKGDDSNDGSVDNPFKTIERARNEVRKYNKNMTGDIVVNIESGRYEISDSIEFYYDDSGFNGHSVIYRGLGDTKPQISGGKRIEGFKEVENGIWAASVDADFVRELSVNGVMAQRAKSSNKIYGVGAYNPVCSSEAVTEANPKGIVGQDGIYVDKSDFGEYKNPEDIELKWDFAHQSTLMHVKNIKSDPDNEERLIVEFKNPEWNSIFNKNESGFSAPLNPGWDVAFSIENAYELMDEPGEFYYDKQEKTLYYIPRDGENMKTAEVICPQIDKLVGIKGRGYLNKIKNITFENIGFAHSTWEYLEEYSVYFRQAEQPSVNFAPTMMTPGAVEVDWADCLTVESCDFYGISTVALKLNEGVTNSKIEGNTFADIGCGAITVGNLQHKSFNPPQSVPSGDAVVSYKKGWSSSAQPSFMPILMQYIYTNDESSSSHTWTNADELAENPNAKSWVRADLGKPYDISEIKISFNNTSEYTYKNEDMSNFEVLVSNDRSFKEYKIAATYGSNTNRNISIAEKFDEKYRYVMFRKTASGEGFAITCYWVKSGDEDKIGQYEAGLCVDNVIKNNYITRVGKIHNGSPAITGYYTESLTIDHNTIVDIPYSGISLGWGWNNENSTAENNKISNNYIKDYMLQCNDGGGIYVLGNNYGTEISGNYIRDGINGYGAIYFDTGSKGYTVSDNVADNTSAAIFQHDKTYSADITVTNTYTTFGDYDMYEGLSGLTDENREVYKARAIVCKGTENNCTAEDPIVMLPNNYTQDAAAVVENAGIIGKYAEISNNVPENNNGLYKGPFVKYGNAKKSVRAYSEYVNENRRANYYLSTFENISENATFGSEKWQYPVKYKYMMREIASRTKKLYNDKGVLTLPSGHSGWCRGVHIDEECMMKYLIESMSNDVTHTSFDEMLEICNAYLNNATEGTAFGLYQSGAKDGLCTAVENALKINRDTKSGEYQAVVILENALNEFSEKEYSDEVIYAYVKDAETSIDKANKKVTLKLPFGAELTYPEFATKGDTEITVDGDLKIDEPLLLKAVNSNVIGEKTEWRLVLTYGEKSESVDVTAEPSKWYNTNENTSFASRDGVLKLVPWLYPYMYSVPSSRDIHVKIKADAEDKKDGISLIAASKSSANLEYDATSGYKNTYYKLSFKGDEVTLYAVKSGDASLIATAKDCGFVYGAYNDISLSVSTASGVDEVTLKIGERTVFDDVKASTIGGDGYFGILSPNVSVDVSELTKENIIVKRSSDKKDFKVKCEKNNQDRIVILAIYKDDMLTDIQYKDYASEVDFSTSVEEYDSAKIMVWSGFDDMVPIYCQSFGGMQKAS